MPVEQLSRKVDFENPPVVETVLGFQFAPLEGWNIPHFGLFWADLQERYPRFEVQPPAGSEIELRFGRNAHDPNKPTVDVVGSIPVRCWFFDHSEATLVQVQNNCFFHNWRKVTGREEYLHYDKVRPLFQEAWRRFLDFLDRQKIQRPKVWQCEVSYVNHIEKGQGWQTFGDLHLVLPSWSGRTSDGFLPSPDVVMVNSVYPIANDRGRLQIVVQPAIRQSDSAEIVQLTLTARGKPASPESDDLFQWLDLGHDWVVQGFKSYTSKEMHKLWRAK